MAIVNRGTPGCNNGGCSINTISACKSGEQLVQHEAVESYRVWDLVNKLCQTPLNVWKMACKYPKYATLPYIGFDRSMFENSRGGIGKVLQFKNIPQHHTLTEDGVSVKWWEIVEGFPEAFVDGDQNSATIKVKTLESLKRFFKDDYVMVYSNTGGENDCCGVEYGVNVVSIDTAALTITFDRVVNVKDGDRILRLYNLISKCTGFENGIALDPTDYFESYFQYFGGKLSFTIEEINKCYATPGGVKAVVDSKMQAMYQSLFLQLVNAFWYGRNVKEVVGQKAQTMGILPAIYAEVAEGSELIHDLSGITVDVVKVKALMEIFELAQKCQIEGIDNTLMVVGNYRFYSALGKLGAAWSQYMGCMPICDKTSDVKFEVRTINTSYGRVEFFVDWFLQTYYPNKSFAVVLPKGLSSIYYPMNDGLSFQNGNAIIERVVPGFKTVDLTDLNKGKVDCGMEVMFHEKLAYIHAGVRSGAYRIIEGLE